jgi:hypothetical protein
MQAAIIIVGVLQLVEVGVARELFTVSGGAGGRGGKPGPARPRPAPTQALTHRPGYLPARPLTCWPAPLAYPPARLGSLGAGACA